MSEIREECWEEAKGRRKDAALDRQPELPLQPLQAPVFSAGEDR